MIQLIIISFFILLAVIGIYVIYKFIVVTRVTIPQSPRIIIAGHNPTLGNYPSEIPRIIWTYWHEPSSPDFVERCQNNWREP